MKVTIDDLRRLLASSLPDAELVLVEGRFQVRTADSGADGAITVISQGDLRSHLDGIPEPADRDLELVAATLETTIVERGA
jgi:hypothetical protein